MEDQIQLCRRQKPAYRRSLAYIGIFRTAIEGGSGYRSTSSLYRDDPPPARLGPLEMVEPSSPLQAKSDILCYSWQEHIVPGVSLSLIQAATGRPALCRSRSAGKLTTIFCFPANK